MIGYLSSANEQFFTEKFSRGCMREYAAFAWSRWGISFEYPMQRRKTRAYALRESAATICFKPPKCGRRRACPIRRSINGIYYITAQKILRIWNRHDILIIQICKNIEHTFSQLWTGGDTDVLVVCATDPAKASYELEDKIKEKQ